ncbi:MAG: hypothetical protein QNJ40_02100 [Xanthomonadales bacterium]|nr:hypothetical protein [Xanthomonadales bacterium]
MKQIRRSLGILVLTLSTTLAVTLGISALAQQADPPAVESHMREHFARATLLQTAIIEADLERAREQAAWLADHGSPQGLPDGWQPFVEDLRGLAAEISAARGLVVAAGATADLALACGRCHQKFQVNTWLESTSMPPQGNDIADRMARHQWAADRLWEGLIGGSDSAWLRGAEILAEVPLTATQVLGEPSTTADFLADRVHRLGREARETARQESRARLYGNLLTTCAECHNQYRNR